MELVSRLWGSRRGRGLDRVVQGRHALLEPRHQVLEARIHRADSVLVFGRDRDASHHGGLLDHQRAIRFVQAADTRPSRRGCAKGGPSVLDREQAAAWFGQRCDVARRTQVVLAGREPAPRRLSSRLQPAQRAILKYVVDPRRRIGRSLGPRNRVLDFVRAQIGIESVCLEVGEVGLRGVGTAEHHDPAVVVKGHPVRALHQPSIGQR